MGELEVKVTKHPEKKCHTSNQHNLFLASVPGNFSAMLLLVLCAFNR